MSREALDLDALRDSVYAMREALEMIDEGVVAARPTERAFIAGAFHALELLIEDVEPVDC